jgi:uncharacterized protein (TIGR02145 family)
MRTTVLLAPCIVGAALLLAVSCSKESSPTSSTPVPDAPVLTSVVAGDGRATVSWSPDSSATSYNLYYRTGTTVDTATGTKITGVVSPEQVTGLTNGVQYAFALSAVNGGGESPLSAVMTATLPATAAPNAPTVASVTAGGGYAIVNWSGVAGAATYNLYYEAGAVVDTATAIKLTGAVSPMRIDSLTNDTLCAFALVAINSIGASPLGAVQTAMPEIVADTDGNVYQTVTIGTLVWMAQNLRTTKYNDGRSIPLDTTNVQWSGADTGACCFYNNDTTTANRVIYGALYNWYAVDSGKLAPTGWHVPADSDWAKLIAHLGGESEAGGKLKESGTAHWASPNTGATDEARFTALPGGCRLANGTFSSIGYYGHWWSATVDDHANSWYRSLNYGYALAFNGINGKQNGFSVRCVRDP